MSGEVDMTFIILQYRDVWIDHILFGHLCIRDILSLVYACCSVLYKSGIITDLRKMMKNVFNEKISQALIKRNIPGLNELIKNGKKKFYLTGGKLLEIIVDENWISSDYDILLEDSQKMSCEYPKENSDESFLRAQLNVINKNREGEKLFKHTEIRNGYTWLHCETSDETQKEKIDFCSLKGSEWEDIYFGSKSTNGETREYDLGAIVKKVFDINISANIWDGEKLKINYPYQIITNEFQYNTEGHLPHIADVDSKKYYPDHRIQKYEDRGFTCTNKTTARPSKKIKVGSRSEILYSI
jgi:hypothetical protein